MTKIQILPVCINENSIYKLGQPDGGYRLRTGSDLIASDHTLVAIRAAGMDNQVIAEILTAYLFKHGDIENDATYTEDEIMQSLDNDHQKYAPLRKSTAAKIAGYLLHGLFYTAVVWIFFMVILHFFYRS